MFEKKAKFIFMFINLIIIILGFFLIKYKNFSVIDDFIYSTLFSSFTDKNSPSGIDEISVVKIDQKFFDKEGVTSSTFHRGYYADLVKRLKSYGAKNIVFDVFFQDLKYGQKKDKAQKIYSKAVEYFDKKFAKSLGENVVLGSLPTDSKKNEILPPSDKFIKKNIWLGYVQSHLNKRGINDGIYPYGFLNNKKILNLGLNSYFNRLYVDKKIDKNIDIKIEKGINIFSIPYLNIKTSNNKFNKKIPLTKDINGNYFIFTPIFIKNKLPRAYSLYDILHDEDGIYESKFKNKTVFIGATDQALNDIKLSYIGIIPGVLFHINSFLSIYSNTYFYILPIGESLLILLIMMLLGYIFVILFKNEKLTFLVYFVILFTLFIASFILFSMGVLFPVGTIIIILTIKLILDILYILFVDQEKRKNLMKWFDKYVGSEVRQEKEKSNKETMTTKKKEIFLMFTDIAGFTNISEKLEAEQVGKMLNIYFQLIGKFIRKSKGYLDKYVGDAIMAYWENQKYADNILEAVINIQKVHPLIKKRVEEELGKEIYLQTRIGLHFGEAIVGDIGDIDGKIQATAIGDNVNLASRLEGINKYYKSNIIISQSFYERIENKNNFAIRLLDKITVKGKTKPLNIYQILVLDKTEVNDDILEYLNEFKRGILFYFQGNFLKAKEIFNKLKIFKLGENDNTLDIFLDRIEHLLKNPPAEWDGVWRFEKK